MLLEKACKKVVTRTLLSSFISSTSLYLRHFFSPPECINQRVKRGPETHVKNTSLRCFRSLAGKESRDRKQWIKHWTFVIAVIIFGTKAVFFFETVLFRLKKSVEL